MTYVKILFFCIIHVTIVCIELSHFDVDRDFNYKCCVFFNDLFRRKTKVLAPEEVQYVEKIFFFKYLLLRKAKRTRTDIIKCPSW